jgi:hypothetical protein
MAELVDATDLTVFNLSILKVTLRLNAPKFREIFRKNTILSLVKVFDFERCRDSMGAIQKIFKVFTNKKSFFFVRRLLVLNLPLNSGALRTFLMSSEAASPPSGGLPPIFFVGFLH